MSRYFLEVCYKGTGFAGFQVQENAQTIQGVVEEAFRILFKEPFSLTGSSRTDSGVHARQNYFHFDSEHDIQEKYVYNLNALLPETVAVKKIISVRDEAHCRFDAMWRQYSYMVYGRKDPFLNDVAYYYPFRVDVEVMKAAAEALTGYRHFEAFSKRNTQVKTYECKILESSWSEEGGALLYRVKANRFLRGMVRGLVGTMLQVGRGRMSVDEFRKVIEGGNSAEVDFSVPGRGLILEKVEFGEGYFA